MAKRDLILTAIQEGGATRESLMEVADVNSKGLASQFTYMRLMGNCPVMDAETKIYIIFDRETYDTMVEDRKANAKSTGPAKTPAERLDAATKRQARCDKAQTAAAERYDKNENEENAREIELRSLKADIELELAEIELVKATTANDAAGDPVDDDAAE